MVGGVGVASNGRKLLRDPLRSKIVLPVAAVLLAAASVMVLMARNLHQATFAGVAPTLAAAAVFALLVHALTALLRRRTDAASAVITCIWVGGSLFYLDLFDRLNLWLEGGYSSVRTLPFAAAAMVLLSLAVHRLRFAWDAVHIVLSVIALVLVANPLWQAAAHEWRHGADRALYDAGQAVEAMPEISPSPTAAASGDGARPPDIYHLVFDRYGSAPILERHYGITEPIGPFLEERGFFVTPESYANYQKTSHSLASTFHMDYLDLFADDPDIKGGSLQPLFEMLDDHRVGRFLRLRDYRLIQFGSWWGGTYHASIAHENHPHGFDEFDMLYLRRTILLPIFHALPETPFTMRLNWDNGQCQRVARQVEEIKAIAAEPDHRPVYVMAHFLVPHGPYVFAPDGRCLTQVEATERGLFQGYVDQIAYADRIIEDLVLALQAPDRPPPVILVQADEGPFPAGRDYGIPWHESPPEELRIKLGIINAYFFPDGDYRQLYPEISPVNSYRALFNTYFGTSFPLLPDRIFAFPTDAQSFELHDVTDRIRNDVDGAASTAAASGSLPSRPRVKRHWVRRADRRCCRRGCGGAAGRGTAGKSSRRRP
jgi:hypothetical protein